MPTGRDIENILLYAYMQARFLNINLPTYLGKEGGTFAAQQYTTVKKPDKWVTNCIVKGRNEPMFIK